MAWNEPGGGGKDPWGTGGGDKGPPDLEEVIRNLQHKLGGLFGGRGRGGGASGSGGGFGQFSKGSLGVVVAIVVAAWLLSGIYIVDQGKRGVVLRFGKYIETTSPGPHWHLPYPIETAQVVDVERRRYVEIGYRSGAGGRTAASVLQEALMLTEDENIVDVQIAVQYQISDPRAYLFNVKDPEETLKQAAESALREVVGNSKMDFVLTQGRSDVVARTESLLQKILNEYKIGLQVTSVNLQDAQPPEQVQAAFADAIKAREDEQRLKNEAEAYANSVVPKARGAAVRIIQESEAYKQQVVAEAQGDASRFDQLLTQYEKAPEVTRERLYLDTIESVLSKVNKVVVDTKNTNNLMYLPLDQLMHKYAPKPATSGSTEESSGSKSPSTSANEGRQIRDTEQERSRGTR